MDNATEDRKRALEEDQKPQSLFKKQRCEALADEEQHKWELPDWLASYANKYFQSFIQDKNLRTVYWMKIQFSQILPSQGS